MLLPWDKLPDYMRTSELRPYYDILKRRELALIFKRVFDFVMALVLLVVLSPVMLIVAILITADSAGTVFFQQERVTSYGRSFKILKFRTMVMNAEQLGSAVTVDKDPRITSIGHKLRKYRLDEIPQLINIILGDMSFVGTRPESTKYVARYTAEYFATLLMPAGLTSLASIEFRDENTMLNNVQNIDDFYVNNILPKKMMYNLRYIREYSFAEDVRLLWKTLDAVIK